jgi:hypothetical protein
MAYTQLTNLDFTQIKTALKDYLRSQSDFTGYDFEGSTWSHLLDVLAYNTYYTAFNTNMVVNELFLDSATLRDNVVTIAKQLGYIPKSTTAPKASVDFNANFSSSSPSTITLKKGSGFVTTYDGKMYNYVVITDYKQVVNGGVAQFRNVPIYEGTLITNSYVVDTSLNFQRFIIDNPSVDTNTIVVKVFPSQGSTSYVLYDAAKNILTATPDSNIYYINEIEDERYEIVFGDGILGRKLVHNEYIEVSYLITSGPETNGSRVFTFSGILEDDQGNSNYSVSITNLQTISASDGGEDIETVSSIKYNAPLNYGAQNRAVTSSDYSVIIRNIYPAIADIIVYGGEEASPPEYGKVKIVIKPKNSNRLSNFTKQDIVKKLKPYMVGSVTCDIIDPSIVYIEAVSSIFYDTKVTTLTPIEIKSRVLQSIQDYISLSETEKFNGKFRYSKFVSVVDGADHSIKSNRTKITLRKDFYPLLNTSTYYELCFQNEFDVNCDIPSVTSTGFVVSEHPSYTSYLEDRNGKMVLYRIDSGLNEKIVLNNFVGTVDYMKGEIKLNNLTIIKGSFEDNKIQVRVRPKFNDIIASRNVYLDVDIQNSNFTAYPE